MKCLIISLIFFSICAISRAERLFLPFLTPESQSSVIVTAAPEHEMPCPLQYTNLFSNTNLFSPVEQKLLKEIPLKYQSVTTNAGPVGTVFKGIELRQWKIERPRSVTMTLSVSCFTYTNSNAREEIGNYGGTTIVIFRTRFGDGYNLQISHNRLLQYQEYKDGKLDGLCIKSIFDADHCNEWARFVKGKIVGKFIGWSQNGKIDMEAKFKEPFDFLKSTFGKFDLAWTEVPTQDGNQ